MKNRKVITYESLGRCPRRQEIGRVRHSQWGLRNGDIECAGLLRGRPMPCFGGCWRWCLDPPYGPRLANCPANRVIPTSEEVKQ